MKLIIWLQISFVQDKINYKQSFNSIIDYTNIIIMSYIQKTRAYQI